MNKVNCWNCGISYSYLLRGATCPNCKCYYHDEWIYNFDWQKWAKDMFIVSKKLSKALSSFNR